MKRIVRGAAADADVEEIIDGYLVEGGAGPASRFVDVLAAAFDHLSRHPATGSPRFGHALGIPGLRSWPLGTFPHVIFYFERQDTVEIWRVLHGRRDIPVQLQDGSGEDPAV